MGNYTFFLGGGGGRKSEEGQASKKFNNKCSENSRPQIVFRTDNFQNLSLGAPVLCHDVHSKGRNLMEKQQREDKIEK